MIADVGQGLMGFLLLMVPVLGYLVAARRLGELGGVARRLWPVGAFYAVYAALVHWTARPGVVFEAVRNGVGLLSLERSLHVAWEASLSRLSLPGATLYYDWCQVFVVIGVLLWCAVSCEGPEWRLARNSLALIAAGGFLCYWLVPVAPPWVLPHSFGIHSAGLRGLTGVGDLMGAFPSLHTAWAGWVAVVVWAQAGGRWWRWLGVGNLVATAVVVVVTGNHYVLDVVAGELLAYSACLASDYWERVVLRRAAVALVGVGA
jgi:hypothetical protein